MLQVRIISHKCSCESVWREPTAVTVIRTEAVHCKLTFGSWNPFCICAVGCCSFHPHIFAQLCTYLSLNYYKMSAHFSTIDNWIYYILYTNIIWRHRGKMYARSTQQSKCITSEASLKIGLFKILMFREQLGKYRLNSYHFSSLLLLVFFSSSLCWCCCRRCCCVHGSFLQSLLLFCSLAVSHAIGSN